MLVKPTDKGKSPPARYVMTLEDVPPGQHPTSITPIANSGGRLKSLARHQARLGMIVNCAIHPMIISRGRLKTILKSLMFIVRPIPNMTIPSR